jgi:diaminopimelate decarboxylase
MKETIFVSGLYSGPSPSAGLGVARSLRAAFPSVRLIGVDYWVGSSGLHHEVFNSTWLKPSWDLIEEGLYARELQAELDGGAFWLPTLDLEVGWLARMLRPHRGLLSPSEAALATTVKPRAAIADRLPLAVSASLDLSASPDEEVYAFCREHSWRVWVKGPHHDAVAVSSWRDLERARVKIGERWQTDRLSIQAHVRGYEESVCLAAVNGTLADAVYIRKRVTTPEGKTWAGRVGDVPPHLLGPIEDAIRAVGWTGGAEIELLRDVDGRLWFLEWNPRFPAWVYGATLAGRNLPGALLRKALGLPAGARALSSHPEFTRVVLEVPVRAELPLPVPVEPDHGDVGGLGKYGAALAAIAPKAKAGAPGPAPASLSPAMATDLAAAVDVKETPHRLFLPRTAEEAFRPLDVTTHKDAGLLRYAYSLKTSPDPEYLALARKAGMFAECISMLEVRRAREAGWAPHEIILNGPGKWWPAEEPPVDGLRAVFCDSIEELERLAASGRSDGLWGARLRVPGLGSRFGVPVDDPAQFERLCAAVSGLPPGRRFGVHVHMASTLVGLGHWRDVVESAVIWATMIESAAGRRVRVLDLGGGYHPDDFARVPFPEVVRFAQESLPELEEVWVEPGRALTQATMAVVTRVLDARRRDGVLEEVVVDACIAELPLAAAYPHRIFRLAGDRAVPIGRGKVRLLGRICMEDDVLSTGLDLPETITVGDRLLVCDAGAYERSMSYAFGRGGY